MPPRRPGHQAAATTKLPAGPALLYIAADGTTTQVDETALTNRRERRIFRALAAAADELADKADTSDADRDRLPVGFQPPTA